MDKRFVFDWLEQKEHVGTSEMKRERLRAEARAEDRWWFVIMCQGAKQTKNNGHVHTRKQDEMKHTHTYVQTKRAVRIDIHIDRDVWIAHRVK